MTGDIVLTEGGPADLAAVMRVMEDSFDPAFGEAWTAPQCAGLLPMAGVWLSLARRDETVIGFALGRIVRDEAELLLLAVHRSSQGKGVGLMLLDERDVLRLAGASDDASAALELGQQRLGQGPGIDCVRLERTVTVDDLSSDPRYEEVWRWLRQRPADTRSGGESLFHSVLSAGVRVDGHVVGTLNVLRHKPFRWTADDVRAVEAYASVIGALMRLGLQERRPTLDSFSNHIP